MDKNALRKLLYEKDKQNNMGTIPPGTSAPRSIPTSRPPQMSSPPQAFKLGAPSAPKFHPSVGGSIKPTSNPSVIPSLPSLPKFAKVKKYFKKS